MDKVCASTHPEETIGRPLRCRSFSTDDVAPSEQLDYWMALAYRSVKAQPAPGSQIYGHASMFGSPAGQFVHAESSAFDTWLSPRRVQTHDTDEHIAIGLLHRGRLQVTQPSGQQSECGAGEMFMFDCGQPMTARWSAYDCSYLRLPRSLVRQALGRDPAELGRVLTPLSTSGLAPFLAAQMQCLALHGVKLQEGALQRMLSSTVEMALYLVSSLAAQAPRGGKSSNAARLQAAYFFMRENITRPGLTPDHVAAALNISRAQLYRAFEHEPMSVKAAVQEIRLQKSREALVQAGPQEKLGAIAFACGFSDPAVFGKQFRKRFGCTPGEARQVDMHAPDPKT